MDLIDGPAPIFLVYFQIGDRIIEVDGVDLRHSTHERAVEVIQAAGNPVCLLVQSLVHLVRPSHDQENIDVTTFPSLSIQIHCHRLISHLNSTRLYIYMLYEQLLEYLKIVFQCILQCCCCCCCCTSCRFSLVQKVLSVLNCPLIFRRIFSNFFFPLQDIYSIYIFKIQLDALLIEIYVKLYSCIIIQSHE